MKKEQNNNCPRCNSTNVVRKNKPGYIIMLSILLLGFPLAFYKSVNHCFDCDYEWKRKKNL